MPGARCTRGLVCRNAQRKAHTSIQVKRRQSDIPCAMALRLISCSPPVSGLFVTVTCRSLRKLNASIAAPEPHDFTVRGQRFVQRKKRLTPPASTASHPNAQ